MLPEFRSLDFPGLLVAGLFFYEFRGDGKFFELIKCRCFYKLPFIHLANQRGYLRDRHEYTEWGRGLV